MGLNRHSAFWIRALRALALLLALLTTAVWAQPLTRGVEIGDSRYLIEGGKVKVIRQGQLDSLASDLFKKPLELYQPSETWSDSFLVKADAGLFRFSGGQFQSLSSPKPEGGTFTPFGDLGIWRDKDGKNLQVYGPKELVADLKVPLIHSAHPIGDSSLLVINSDQTYMLYQVNNWAYPLSGSCSIPLENLQVTVSGEQVLLWAKDSRELLQPLLSRGHSLPSPPTLGVKAVRNDRFLVGMPDSLLLLDKSGTLQPVPSPEGLNAENFGVSPLFFEGAELLAVVPAAGHLQASAEDLGEMTLKSVLIPEPSSSNRPILFGQTKLEETKIDGSGEVVKDPKTGKEETRTINGHNILMLSQTGWSNLVSEPRARLLGPAEMVGPYIIYATQTKPTDQVGQKRPYNGRYPSPKIVLHALNPTDGSKAWSLDLARGEAPSMARLPEEHWPVLGKDGPLLITTEADRLAALDPVSGKILWTTGQLALDDSRPAMFSWNDSLGLVATMHTTKKMILFDNQGKRLGAFRLNSIFNSERTLNLIGVVIICLALVIYIYIAGKKKLFIRRIAGLEALDEAVGRATEMGKPVLYVTGLADVDDIQTLASLSILSHVAKKTAEYDTDIIATTSRAVTFSAAQEVVRDAFTIAGRPDSFHIDSVQYISDDQFGYAAGVDGIMVREEPAANFYMGKFYAESLIFAETGHATGAIQIAGTAMPNQLPFFVAACDYTLIGEELFAASAYLSGDPLQVGSLRGQDVGKAIVMIFLILASLLVTADAGLEWEWAGKLTSFFGGWLS